MEALIIIVNWHQNELLWYFPQDVKIGPSQTLLNWYAINWWLFNINVDSAGIYQCLFSIILSTLL